MASSSRSLVLSIATRYPAAVLYPFLQSLRATSYGGRMVVIIKDIAPAQQDLLRPWVDELIDVGPYYDNLTAKHGLLKIQRLLKKTKALPRGNRLLTHALFRFFVARASKSSRAEVRQSLEMGLMGLQSLRYGHYRQYLERQSQLPERVLICDIRDIVFQADPFADATEAPELEAFLEGRDSTDTIGKNHYNRNWINLLYGAAMVDKLKDKPVSCSGTTIGTGEGMLRYCRAMATELAKHNQPLGPCDQGMHNVLLHTGQLDPVTVRQNGCSSVLTVGGFKSGQLQPDAQERVLNEDGSVPAVLHQYDRHANLKQWAARRFGSGKATGEN